jgi:hypothetical protein
MISARLSVCLLENCVVCFRVNKIHVVAALRSLAQALEQPKVACTALHRCTL